MKYNVMYCHRRFIVAKHVGGTWCKLFCSLSKFMLFNILVYHYIFYPHWIVIYNLLYTTEHKYILNNSKLYLIFESVLPIYEVHHVFEIENNYRIEFRIKKIKLVI